MVSFADAVAIRSRAATPTATPRQTGGRSIVGRGHQLAVLLTNQSISYKRPSQGAFTA